MRMLTSSVLAFEAIVLLLAIPVAIVVSGAPPLGIAALSVLAVACALLPALFKQRWFLGAGWAVQVLVVLSGLLVPMMFVLGLVFAALWATATHLGSKPGAAQTSG